ncbi:TPA: hypothetical protein HA251_08320 [Candidatus Woesearchaeota archaeon]|nr:hypothetical protein [Candidatus Woesearchaeota archaeon]
MTRTTQHSNPVIGRRETAGQPNGQPHESTEKSPLEEMVALADGIVGFSRIAEREATFLRDTIAPELLKYNERERHIILKRFRAVVENRAAHPSPFPVKEYDRELVHEEGVRRVADPIEMARMLALGIISSDERLREKSHELYQEDVLRAIRSSIDRKRVYGNIKRYLNSDDPADAAAMLDAMANPRLSNNNQLRSMTEFVRRRIAGEDGPVTSLVARTNERTIDLSRSFGRYGCCAFWGTGEQEIRYQMDLDSRYHASVLYLADPEIGLLFNHLEKDGKLDIPSGVVIMASMLESDPSTEGSERRALLIDSVEAYRPSWDRRFPDNPLREMKNDIWRRQNYNAILGIAADIGADAIVYNDDFWNEGGNTFTRYFLERAREDGHTAIKRAVSLRKEGGRSFIPPYYRDNFGFFLDCITPKENYHDYHAVQGSMDGCGNTTAWVVDL